MSTLSFVHHLEPGSGSTKKIAHDGAAPSTTWDLQTVPSVPSTSSPLNTSTVPTSVALSTPEVPTEQNDVAGVEFDHPKIRITAIMASLCASVFVAAIDMTIITTALPAIAENFHSASGYQWVGSSYVLGCTASTPSWGKVSDIWGRKPILLLAILIFAAGSLICALGKSMAVFLAGRAIQGIGGSGLLTLVNVAISDLFSMRDRSFYYGLTSVVWAFASGIGPVLGGIFTQQLT
jgi:hypothetical protein